MCVRVRVRVSEKKSTINCVQRQVPMYKFHGLFLLGTLLKKDQMKLKVIMITQDMPLTAQSQLVHKVF